MLAIEWLSFFFFSDVEKIGCNGKKNKIGKGKVMNGKTSEISIFNTILTKKMKDAIRIGKYITIFPLYCKQRGQEYAKANTNGYEEILVLKTYQILQCNHR